MKLAVLLNPNALGVRRDPGLTARLQAVAGAGVEVVVTRTPDELGAVARRFADGGVELVAACGGDGTNLSTLTALVRAYGRERLPALAILRGGTVNTIARNLGIRGRPDELLARVVAAVRAGGDVATVEQDSIEVDGRFGFLFASLMGARFLEAYYAGQRPGLASAALLTARTMASSLVQGATARALFAPAEVTLTVDGEPLPAERYRLLVAATVADVGMGFRVPWRAGQEPGRFHLVASGITTTAMALQLPRVFAGRPLAGAPHLDRLAARVHVRFAAPESYTLDGDLFRAAEVSIATGPRVRIVRV